MNNPDHTDELPVYACPMHPEVTGIQGDKCPKCGMTLVATKAEESARYEVELTTLPKPIVVGKSAILTLAITQDGQHVPLEVSHEMKVHLMVVSEDLRWYRHIHPIQQTDGTYTVTETFHNGGRYLLFADFKPMGGAQVLRTLQIDVEGYHMTSAAEMSAKWVSDVACYTVTLENGNDFETGRVQPLKITLAKDGKKLKESDLEQYLGASAHIVMISAADKEFLHIHPVFGSDLPIYAEAHIEQAGTYRMWVQFKIDGQVHTADFTVEVASGEKSGQQQSTHHAHQH
ncbi:heavy metal-binding domain-containing protein [Sphingobacterium sp. SYP-B4668]|uniref:heavy metal-binding domain-containing protein n=1 Tax=Sphingobacterium sp. SYP-B4668 TaxID=2996035 RepID=UPI0022DD2D49|nr:heavy metal-binding domain-containing protein [Sphingobacterium sp. SYP-B4668]